MGGDWSTVEALAICARDRESLAQLCVGDIMINHQSLARRRECPEAAVMTAPSQPMSVAVVEPSETALIEKIMALADAHKATLGYMPWGAWPQFAEKHGLIAAKDDGGSLLGYALFSTARDRVRLIQLCTSIGARNQGVSRLLVDESADRHRSLRGIVAKCRPEYEANAIWPKLGFVPVNEVQGRSAGGSSLTVWFRDNNLPDLFSLGEDDSALLVALDHNVFLDLCISRHRNGAAESQAVESKNLIIRNYREVRKGPRTRQANMGGLHIRVPGRERRPTTAGLDPPTRPATTIPSPLPDPGSCAPAPPATVLKAGRRPPRGTALPSARFARP